MSSDFVILFCFLEHLIINFFPFFFFLFLSTKPPKYSPSLKCQSLIPYIFSAFLLISLLSVLSTRSQTFTSLRLEFCLLRVISSSRFRYLFSAQLKLLCSLPQVPNFTVIILGIYILNYKKIKVLMFSVNQFFDRVIYRWFNLFSLISLMILKDMW